MQSPINRLYERERYAFALKHPNNPYITIPKLNRPDTANGIQNAIIRWCSAHGYFAKRINTMGIPQQTHTGIKWRTSGSTKGAADVMVTLRNESGLIALNCEVKAGRDQIRESQERFRKRAESTGIETYIIVHSFDEFLDWWDDNGILDNLKPSDHSPLELDQIDSTIPDQTVKETPIRRKVKNTILDIIDYNEKH